MSDDESESRRNVLKALGAGGLAATGLAASSGSAAAAPGGLSLTNVADSLDLTDGSGNIVGTVSDLSITDLQIDQRTGELLSSGTLEYTTESGQTATESFQNVTTEITDTSDGCTILTLDLGPLDLELLGLNVNLSDVQLSITGSTGAGNLLGNLLCAIADLGSGGLSNLANSLVSALNNLLNQLLG